MVVEIRSSVDITIHVLWIVYQLFSCEVDEIGNTALRIVKPAVSPKLVRYHRECIVVKDDEEVIRPGNLLPPIFKPRTRGRGTRDVEHREQVELEEFTLVAGRQTRH